MPVDPDELKWAADMLDTLTYTVRAAIAELAELRQRPAPLRWTRERPTEPGDYVMQISARQFDAAMYLVRIVRDHAERLVAFWGPSYATGLPDAEFWYGPIPEPVEPEEPAR